MTSLGSYTGKKSSCTDFLLNIFRSANRTRNYLFPFTLFMNHENFTFSFHCFTFMNKVEQIGRLLSAVRMIHKGSNVNPAKARNHVTEIFPKSMK